MANDGGLTCDDTGSGNLNQAAKWLMVIFMVANGVVKWWLMVAS